MQYFPTREVLRNVYVGSKGSALSKAFFDSHNIRYVVNCTKDVPFNPNYPDIQGLRIPVDDAPSQNNKMSQYLPFAVSAIISATQRDREGGVLVHCLAGQQRSATIVAGVLIRQKKMTPQEAIEYIQEIKPECFRPRATFLPSLQQYHANILR